MDNEDIKIKIFLANKAESEKVLATASISLKTTLWGFITVKGFRIWKSSRLNERLQEYINITPPVKYAFGRYLSQAFFEDADKWYDIEQKIYDALCTLRTKSTNNEEIDLDEIDKGISGTNK